MVFIIFLLKAIIQMGKSKAISLYCLFVITLGITAHFETVAIIGTNDIHGVALPVKIKNTITNETYESGGIQYLAQMIETIKDEYKGNALYFDAGDQFKGGFQSSPLISKGGIMADFYNILKVDASAIGNHQFDDGAQFLKKYEKQRHNAVNLAANIESQEEQSLFINGYQPSKMFTLKSGIKIGVIGLITVETSENPILETQFPQISFKDYAPFVLQENKKLREKGAHAVLIISHVGNSCNANETYGLWDEFTEQESTCSSTDEISKLLEALPTGTIDGIVQGHRHKFSHHFIKGVPVMGVINGGGYFNVMYLKFYRKKIYERTIEGPIPVCEKIFENTRTCFYMSTDELRTAGKLVSWEFHGKKVQAHKALQALYNEKWMPIMKQYLEPLTITQVYLGPNHDSQSDLRNLITNLMHSVHPQSDFSLAHSQVAGKVWFPGVISYSSLFRMYSSGQRLSAFQILGEDLLKALVILQSNKQAFYTAYGLSQKVSIDGSGRKKFVSAKLSNGTDIELGKVYRGVMIDQELERMKDNELIFKVKNAKVLGSLIELIAQELMKIKVIRQGELIDPAHPRLEIQHL